MRLKNISLYFIVVKLIFSFLFFFFFFFFFFVFFFFFWYHCAHLIYLEIEYRSTRKLEPCCMLLFMNRLNKTESSIFGLFDVSFVPVSTDPLS